MILLMSLSFDGGGSWCFCWRIRLFRHYCIKMLHIICRLLLFCWNYISLLGF
ncbi:unnamed protein product [Larinioides sclopetarius]|uniref:Uncharacterized protein n=1 Tax=Larinioides sclopetarius TaxID=280406 RepID=A0AAV2BVZ9_9ARAC